MHSRKLTGFADKKGQAASASHLPRFMRTQVEEAEIAEKPETPPVHESTVSLSSNLYKLNLPKKDIFVYCYIAKESTPWSGANMDEEHSKPTDVMESMDYAHVHQVVSTALREQLSLQLNDFFFDPCSARLYTLIPLPNSEMNTEFNFLVDTQKGNLWIVRDGVFEIRLRHMLYNVKLPNMGDALLDAFVNTAVNNAFTKRNDYFQLEETHYSRYEAEVSDPWKKLVIGSRTSVERVEGEEERTPAIAVNVITNYFYVRLSVLNYLRSHIHMDEDGTPRDMSHLSTLSKAMTGVTVVLNFYRKFNPFVIVGLSWRNPEHTKFPIRNSSGYTKVSDYLRDKHGIELNFPQAPLAEVVPELSIGGNRRDKRPLYYPVELLDIVVHQRMPREFIEKSDFNGNDLDRQEKIKKVAPQIQKNVRSAGIGMEMMSTPLTVKAGVLNPPDVVLNKTTNVKVDPATGRWNWHEKVRFARPANLGKMIWAVMVLSDERLTVGHEHIAEEFAVMCRELAQSRGLELIYPYPLPIVRGREQILELLRPGTTIRFVLFIMPKGLGHHKFTKIEVERAQEIVTQTVTWKTVNWVTEHPHTKRARIIVENVVLKMNVKLGGVNHDLTIGRPLKAGERKPLKLFIGLTLRNAKNTKIFNVDNRFGGLTPATVGFSANTGHEELEFLGDFMYQYAKNNCEITYIEIILREICKRFAKAKGAPADEVYVFRDLEDFEYQHAVTHEIPRITQAVEDNHCASMVYIAVSRKHNVRFFPKMPELQSNSNLLPGTVVDSVAVDADLKQFYLASYTVSIGTTRPARFTVLSDICATDLKDLEKLTYDLCFAHQTSTRSHSTPVPLTVAKDYARRGFILAEDKIKNTMLRFDKKLDPKKLNQSLRYSQTACLKHLRVTA